MAVARRELVGQIGDGRGDLLGPVVQRRRQRVDVDLPAAAPGDLIDVQG